MMIAEIALAGISYLASIESLRSNLRELDLRCSRLTREGGWIDVGLA